MMKGLHAAKLYPIPDNETALHGNINTYWKHLKDTSNRYFGQYMGETCDGRIKYVYLSRTHIHTPPCYGYLNIVTDVKANLQR